MSVRAMKPSTCRPPVEYVVLKVHVYFPHSLLGCAWLWEGEASVYFGITYVWEYFLSLLWGTSTNIDIIYWYPKYNLNDINKIFKNSMRVSNLNGVYEKYLLGGKHLAFEIFFSCPFDVFLGVTSANMLEATQWPLHHAPYINWSSPNPWPEHFCRNMLSHSGLPTRLDWPHSRPPLQSHMSE